MIETNETELKGKWIFDGKSVKEDSISIRIRNLTSKYLIKIAADESDWCELFRDPTDNRYWELSFPNSEYQGGGPPC